MCLILFKKIFKTMNWFTLEWISDESHAHIRASRCLKGYVRRHLFLFFFFFFLLLLQLRLLDVAARFRSPAGGASARSSFHDDEFVVHWRSKAQQHIIIAATSLSSFVYFQLPLPSRSPRRDMRMRISNVITSLSVIIRLSIRSSILWF